MVGPGRLGIAIAIALAAGTVTGRAGELGDGNRALFVKYCAACHGENGKGGGIVASALAKPVPDLTGLSRDNSGRFPLERVIRAIDGRNPVAAHGTSEMPVWGDVFAADLANPGDDKIGVRDKVRRLAEHIRSIQQAGS